jgi:adenosylcobinamide-GDP ribazoletransferase
VVVSLLLQTAGLASAIGQHRGTLSLLVAVTAGRVAVATACAREPAATPEGMGALVAGTARRGVTRAWVLVLPLLAAAVLALDPDATRSPAVRAVLGAAAAVAALGLARLVRHHAVRRVGGLTGDVLGALSEVATTAALVVLGLAS